MNQVPSIVAGLREDQKIHEHERLNNDPEALGLSIVFRLIALYNWAKATETLVVYALKGKPAETLALLDKLFESAIEVSAKSNDVQLAVMLKWIHVSARIMVMNSLW